MLTVQFWPPFWPPVSVISDSWGNSFHTRIVGSEFSVCLESLILFLTESVIGLENVGKTHSCFLITSLWFGGLTCQIRIYILCFWPLWTPYEPSLQQALGLPFKRPCLVHLIFKDGSTCKAQGPFCTFLSYSVLLLFEFQSSHPCRAQPVNCQYSGVGVYECPYSLGFSRWHKKREHWEKMLLYIK